MQSARESETMLGRGNPQLKLLLRKTHGIYNQSSAFEGETESQVIYLSIVRIPLTKVSNLLQLIDLCLIVFLENVRNSDKAKS